MIPVAYMKLGVWATNTPTYLNVYKYKPNMNTKDWEFLNNKIVNSIVNTAWEFVN